ncbi:SDR family NAD(P)-dependent oxidoreductase [Sutcliffiella rhizosphaerae]|uniref:GDP-L-fucose synthase n=1 Tax=Sutcliffiella rhizosphaerae TaxID=2880967 RepID=A0ABM8YK23_9BACI|nr:SDR family NAD(P)-dependent oxidoreductase [Sutcliffiella rhizosphaerae]CAG9620247.1 GDP-L-fucose synthase [Sutcliffiella rhizosphaerae]
MKKALVIGASGGMGYALVKELVKRKFEVVAFARREEKLKELFQHLDSVKIVSGDARNIEMIIEAAAQVDIIFHALNLPYHQWENDLITITENIVQAAEQTQAKLAVVDNIYAYGSSSGRPIMEDKPKMPTTKKGRLRMEMGKVVDQAKIPAFICHFPDFYGPNADNTYMHFTLEQLLTKKRAGYIGRKEIPREFLYTYDGAQIMVDLALDVYAYGQSWNVPAIKPITGKTLEGLVKTLLGEEKRFYFITGKMFQFLGLFAGRDIREASELQYINEEATILCGDKLKKFLPKATWTSYEQGLTETIEHMKSLRQQ